MKNLEWLLQEAVSKNLFDIMVSNQSGLRFQKGSEWIPSGDEKWIYLEVKNLIFSLLTEEQRKELISRGGVAGVNLLKSGERVKFVAFENKDFIQLQLRVFKAQITPCAELGLPEIVEKWVQRPKGLILISGVSRSGRSTTWAALVQKAIAEKNIHAFISMEEDLFDFKSGKSTYVKFKSQQSLRGAAFSSHGAQLIALDENPTDASIRELVHHLEEGKLVIATASGGSVAAALQNFYLTGAPERREHTLKVLGDNFVGGVNQVVIPQVHQGEALLSEVVVGSPQIKSLIQQGQFLDFDKVIKESSDKYAMMTLNQALLQAIVRRRVDLKLAFILSPDPENLEALMKKVGI